MASLGVNYNLHDMWRSVNQKMADMDLDKDGIVSIQEYTNYILFQVTRAIALQKEQQQHDGEKDPEEGKAAARGGNGDQEGGGDQ
jgi:hypothetical protein